MRRALSALVFLVLAGSATAAVVARHSESAAAARPIAASGSFSFANSGDGAPIFSATGIAPGDSVSGSVEIANSGGEPGQLRLSQHDVTDIPGSGGGELSRRLGLQVTDVTAPAHPVPVYAGPLAPMPAQAAGQLQPGERRTYEFVATLPAAGPVGASAQNDVQGASASVAYTWTASEVSASAEAATDPTPAAAAATKLRLAITRVRHRIRHGRLLVWAGCNTTCRISARGHLHLRGTHVRPARLRLSRRAGFVVGTQRLTIRLPRHIRRRLAANPGDLRLIARIVLRARNSAGETAAARRTLRAR